MHLLFEGIMSDTSTFMVAPRARDRDKGPAPPVDIGAPQSGGGAAPTRPSDRHLFRLRQAIVEGAYRVDPRRIAGKLLERGSL